jgi:hypothetical protein
MAMVDKLRIGKINHFRSPVDDIHVALDPCFTKELSVLIYGNDDDEDDDLDQQRENDENRMDTFDPDELLVLDAVLRVSKLHEVICLASEQPPYVYGTYYHG